MILQALNELYERLIQDPEEGVPLRGFSREKVQFVFVIDRQGRLIQIKDLRDERKAAKPLVVPAAVKRSVNIQANFLCDSTGYVLGRDSAEKEKTKKNPERMKMTFEVFKRLHHEIGDTIEDEGMKAVLQFLDGWNPLNLESSPCWPMWSDLAGAKIVFQLEGQRGFIHEREEVQKAWLRHGLAGSSEYEAMCLVSGARAPIARLHSSIKGVLNSQSMGGDIVSNNLDAFKSYGKDQSFNAPVSEEAMFNYTTALNHLLRRDSRQRIQIGDATTVFWADGETKIVSFLKDILDPVKGSPAVGDIRLFLEGVRDGKHAESPDAENRKFFILGLSPNAKRLAVRFWLVSTVKDMEKRLGQHFQDLSLEREFEDSQPEFPGLWHLLHVTGVRGETRNISGTLAGAVTRAVFTGEEYPRALLTAVIQRIRADQEIGYLRAALVKAYLVRRRRIRMLNEKEVCMSLDKEQGNIGYLLGRLFAVLERAQKGAVPGVNATIKDRFYGSASATPSVVFPQLLRLAQHHIQKAEFGKSQERMIGEIVENIRSFPAHLDLEQQGMFALGYYHQKQDFFKKVETKED